MKSNTRVVPVRSAKNRQYTLRNIPADVDLILKQRAVDTDRSFNEVAVEALTLGAGAPRTVRDLSDIAGTMTDNELRAMEREIKNQRKIDRKMWK